MDSRHRHGLYRDPSCPRCPCIRTPYRTALICVNGYFKCSPVTNRIRASTKRTEPLSSFPPNIPYHPNKRLRFPDYPQKTRGNRSSIPLMRLDTMGVLFRVRHTPGC
jgi:hypothetical protein